MKETQMELQVHLNEILSRLKLKVFPMEVKYMPHELGLIKSPVDGLTYAKFEPKQNIEKIINDASLAQIAWKRVPAPKRGELVAELTALIRKHKAGLGWLVSFETGKILSEGLGEIQEMIDMGEYAVGLSRSIHGLTLNSERPEHRLEEVWHPLGVVGLITAFNFPVAVWAWNAMLALVCGNSVVWKPHPETPLTAMAIQHLFEEAAHKVMAPKNLNQIIWGGAAEGEKMVDNPLIKLISATGSTEMGKKVALAAAPHLKKTLLELGGNNAVIVSLESNLDLAVRAITFGACGTAGQRCTSIRRVFVHESIIDIFAERLGEAFRKLPIGSPLDEKVLVGPLFNQNAFDKMMKVLSELPKDAKILSGGTRFDAQKARAYYVNPTIVQMKEQIYPMTEETFAPIVYLMSFEDLEQAIALNNQVSQGLSSAIFSDSLQETMTFLGALGSDCGLANVNCSTSGAEIGGAFGGEKMTGGGREAGSDAWKAYMRRQTQTINYSFELPLSQGVNFD